LCLNVAQHDESCSTATAVSKTSFMEAYIHTTSTREKANNFFCHLFRENLFQQDIRQGDMSIGDHLFVILAIAL
jgi:hypothetical protein